MQGLIVEFDVVLTVLYQLNPKELIAKQSLILLS